MVYTMNPIQSLKQVFLTVEDAAEIMDLSAERLRY